VAKDDTSHAAPLSAKAAAVGIAFFFFAVIVAAIAYALAG
jgi:hypothetical protein